ncbi:thiaminase II [Microbaculum sp. A6E488]|uniref:Aminopyrimidine aminohydrolase n=1 Tax=Microbaculum marinisediminis TaxID=2931392 RepID=A0AAW5QWV5_9HYPH|nr:thiaminase II [Microbaculum sp. A6E488]MCT8972407.1 thiaminase II [Microbaculum sp. A6E488]
MSSNVTPFSAEAWRRNADLYEAIRTLPFNTELAAGALRQDRFQHYIVQDGHYLADYARALAIAAAKADDANGIIQFSKAATEAIVVERALHETYFARFGIDRQAFEAIALSPACHHYTAFLLATAYAQPYPVVLAALLPCFWVYGEVGKDILANATTPDNPYQAWIDTYGGEDFQAAVDGAIATTDRVAAGETLATREAMHLAFQRAMQLEWMFWDSAHRLEAWPV